MTCGLVCRKVLRNSLFESQGESQGTTKAQDPPHTFCIAMLDRATLYHCQCQRFLNAIIFFVCLHSLGDDLWPRLPEGPEKFIV